MLTLFAQENVCIFVHKNKTVAVSNVHSLDNVDILLEAVEQKCKVSPGDFWLAFQGRKLLGGRTLQSYGICSGSTVNLAIRGRGGGCSFSRADVDLNDPGRRRHKMYMITVSCFTMQACDNSHNFCPLGSSGQVPHVGQLQQGELRLVSAEITPVIHVPMCPPLTFILNFQRILRVNLWPSWTCQQYR